MENFSKEIRILEAATIAIVVLFVAIRLDIPPRIDLILAALTGVGSYLLLPKLGKPTLREKLNKKERETYDKIAEAIGQLRQLGTQIRKPEVASEIAQISTVANKLMLECNGKSELFDQFASLLPYVLEKAVVFSQKYLELSEASTPSTRCSLAKAERAFPLVRQTLDDIFDKTQRGEAVSLETEIDCFERTLRLERLLPEAE